MNLGLQCRNGFVILVSALSAAACSSSSSDANGNTDGGAITNGSGGATQGSGGATQGSGGATQGSGGATQGSGGAAKGSGGSSKGGASPSSGGSSNGSGGAGVVGTGKPGTVAGCTVFTADDDWNLDISGKPMDQTWTDRVQTVISTGIHIHPDYGSGYGIPINSVPQGQPAVPITFDSYPDESDPGPYPFPDPATIHIEGGTPASCDGDCHVLVVQSGACMLYEGYACSYASGWHCGNGAKWDLTKKSYLQRPKGWTSADAAGLAIMPGLVRVDEVRAGAVNHAIRFTMGCSAPNFVAPATHRAGCGNSNVNSPPMGLRVRLNKTKFDITTLSPSAQVVAKAMQNYGLILADNGSDFFFQGEDSPDWTDQDIEPLKTIPASAFEAITPPPLEQ
jgi:hypothetical protein